MSTNNTAVSIEELLKPRYKVIASYPGYTYSVGCILCVADDGELYSKEEGYILNRIYEKDVAQYPHLFQPLTWYAERKEMPEYIKETFYGQVFHVKNWNGTRADNADKVATHNMLIDIDSEKVNTYLEYLPATAEEYITYINSLKTTDKV